MREKGKENRCTKTIHHDANNNNLPSLSLGIAKVTKFQKFPYHTHTSFVAAGDFNLMVLNLGPWSWSWLNITDPSDNLLQGDIVGKLGCGP